MSAFLVTVPRRPNSDTRANSVLARLAPKESLTEGRFWRERSQAPIEFISGGTSGATFAASSDRRWWVAFEGVLHNANTLRDELKVSRMAPGGKIASLVVEALSQWGLERSLLRMEGEWKLVAWNDGECELLLARDRFGSRPLYYATMSCGSVVVSDALRPFPAVGFKELNRAALIYSNYQWETTPHTVLRGVFSAPAGAVVRLGEARAPKVDRWWRTIDHVSPGSTSVRKASRELRELVLDAVRVRIPERESFATSLSGGLDSSIVAAAVNLVLRDLKEDRDRQHLHHQSFAGTGQDESRYAAMVANHIGVPLIDTGVEPAAIASHLRESILAFEGDHFMPLSVWWHFNQIAAGGLRFSFEGLMTDSLFAGSKKIANELRLTSLRHGDMARWASLVLGERPTGMGARITGLSRAFIADGAAQLNRQILSDALRRRRAQPDAFGTFTRFWTRWHRGRKGDPTLLDELEELETSITMREEELEEETDHLPPIDRILYRQVHMSGFPPDIRNFWRLSSAHDVTIVNPFCDPRIVTFAFSVPEGAKTAGGWSKRILRDAFADALPSEVIWRRGKLGFTAPMLDWTSAILGPAMVDWATQRQKTGALVEAGLASEILHAHAAGDVLRLRRMWPMVQREIWLAGLLESYESEAYSDGRGGRV